MLENTSVEDHCEPNDCLNGAECTQTDCGEDDSCTEGESFITCACNAGWSGDLCGISKNIYVLHIHSLLYCVIPINCASSLKSNEIKLKFEQLLHLRIS